MTMITDAIIRKRSQQYDPEIVLQLNLQDLSIVAISNLDRCTNVTDLNLSYNKISELNGLDVLPQLQRLDISHNKIHKLSILSKLVNLEYLDLRMNAIKNLEELNHLKMCFKLKTLYLQGADGEDANEICANPNYTSHVLSLFPNLLILDGSSTQLLGFVNDVISSSSDEITNSESVKFDGSAHIMQQKSSLDDIADNISKLIKSESTSLLEEAQRLIDSQLQS